MIDENNETMQEASQTLYELLADKTIQDKCLAREEYNRTIRTFERDLHVLEVENAEQRAALAEKTCGLGKRCERWWLANNT